MLKYIFLSFSLCFCLIIPGKASEILMPMDNVQANHLKAYGVAYWILQNGETVDWLLNYRGGSFAVKFAVLSGKILVVQVQPVIFR